jgi:hypothetical protein
MLGFPPRVSPISQLPTITYGLFIEFGTLAQTLEMIHNNPVILQERKRPRKLK